ncbi:MAG: HAD family phosphatase [Bacteroidales bacterium]|jgi:HAD superfamily hydrolase (TIGR01509 family)|nr:HAD family phosphatase [Bacteroidales bacterium]
MNFQHVKAALFDLDGTLIDTEQQYSLIWQRVGQMFRPDIPNLQDAIKGNTLKRILERFFADAAVRQQVVKMLDDYEAQMNYDFFPGAKEFIIDMKQHGVKCAVVTSSDQKKMQHARHKNPELDTLFDRIFTAEDFAASKPDPDCYLRAASAYGLEKSQCIVFEDAFSGLQSGMSAGIFTVGLASYNPREAIQDKCNLVLDSFDGMTYDRLAELLKNV